MALLSLLISPVSWRHHYLLALLPLIYMWNIAEKKVDILFLAIAALSIGSVLPDYVIAAVRNPLVDIGLASLIPISAILLLWRICVNHFESEGISEVAS